MSAMRIKSPLLPILTLLALGGTAAAVSRTASTTRVPVPVFSLSPAIQGGQRLAEYPGNCTDPNVALYESFDEQSGDLTVPSGCAAAGTTISKNGTPIYGVAGPIGLSSAIKFNGTDAFFRTAGDVATLDPGTANMVVEGWITAQAIGRVVSKWNNSNNGWMVDISASSDYTVRFFIADGTHTCSVNGGVAKAFGQRVYFRATWTFSTATCVIMTDNDAGASSTGVGMTAVDVSNKFAIASQDNGTNLFTGSIADLRVTIGNNTNAVPMNDGSDAIARAATQVSANCTDSGAAAWLAFEEASGNLTVPSGCAASGTVLVKNGTPLYGSTVGVPAGLGAAVTLPTGSDFFATTSHISALDPGTTSDFVIEGWFRQANAGLGFLVDTSSNESDKGYLVYLGAGNTPTIRVAIKGSSLIDNSTSQIAAIGVWHAFKVVASRSGQTIQTTLDGVVNASVGFASLGTSISGTSVFAVGGSSFSGQLADIRVTVGNATSGIATRFPMSSLPMSTFTRATVSTRYNPDTQLLEAVVSGLPVIGSPLQSSGALPASNAAPPEALYAGAAMTFSVLQNEDLSQAVWNTALGASVTTNTDTAPDGNVTADTVTDDNAGTVESLIQDVTVPADSSTWIFSAWVRCPTTTQTVGIANELGAGNTTTTATCSSTWTRITASKVNNGVDTSARLYIYPAQAAAGNLASVNVWRPEFYNNAFTLPIDPATTAASVTINADALSYVTGASNGDVGTICMWAFPPAITGVGHRGLLSWDGTSSFNFFENGASAQLAVSTTGLVDNISTGSSTAVDADTWNHVCTTYAQALSSVKLFKNGIETGYGAHDQTWSASGAYGQAIKIGNTSIGTFKGFLGGVHLYDRVLTPTEVCNLFNQERGVYGLAAATCP
jgi:hypothetical protein